MARNKEGCFGIGAGLFLLGGTLGGATGAHLAAKNDGCEADLSICKMGRETRQQELEMATQELNQCRQQIKRMR